MSPELERLAREVRDTQPKVVLTRAEALDVAARFLEREAAALGLSARLLKTIDVSKHEGVIGEAIAAIKKEAIEPDLQVAAMRSASAAIRELAMEDRLVAAKAAQQQDRTR